jgi:hypothetical protein
MPSKALNKSLELMMANGSQGTNSVCDKEANASSTALPDPEQLTTLELLYHYFKEDGDHVIGNPKSVFATYTPETEKLEIFAADQSSFEIVPYRTITMLEALDFAQEKQASFSVKATQVTCQIGAIQATGGSYPEAALRALVKHLRLLKSAK